MLFATSSSYTVESFARVWGSRSKMMHSVPAYLKILVRYEKGILPFSSSPPQPPPQPIQERPHGNK